MTITDNKDKKIITLSKPLDSKSKVLNFIYSMTFLIPALCILSILLFANDLGFTVNGGLFFLFCICLIAGYKFINSSFKTERIIITENFLIIQKASFFKKNMNSYDCIYIKNFRYLEKAEITKHPLAGQSFDYLGFQTEQQVINEMYGDHKLAFDYNGKTIRFGENIYSWHFEEIVSIFQKTMNNGLNYVEESLQPT